MSAIGFPAEFTTPAETRSGVWKAVQATERLAALAALVLLLPILVVVAGAILLLSRRAPLVAHLRVGRYGQPLWILKLRTMWPREHPDPWDLRWVDYIVEEPGLQPKACGDPRVTHPFAKLCRRYSIDEIPQLIHVAAGQMSLVGPRPLTRTELLTHYGNQSTEVLQFKPGITGLWQVKGRNRLTYRQRVRLDLFYVRAASAALYLHVLWLTIPCVLRGKDAW